MPAVSVEYRNMYYPETELSTRCCPLVTNKCGTGKGPIDPDAMPNLSVVVAELLQFPHHTMLPNILVLQTIH